MLYKYSFGNNNVSRNDEIPVPFIPLQKIANTDTIDDNFINIIYDDNIIHIIYYDSTYYIKIMVDDVIFQFENVPWDFILKKITDVTNQIHIIDSTFDKSITISVDNILFTGCEFSLSNANYLDPGSSLILYNIGIINLYLTDCLFNYDNRALPIDGIAQNVITTSNSRFRIKPIIDTTEKIDIYNLFYLHDKFTFELDPANLDTAFRFADISTNINFKLLDDVIIENTFFTRQCTFDLNGSDITFSGCTFDNNINDNFLCTTYNNDINNTSNVNFIKYNDNYNILYPRKAQIYNNKLWNWNLDPVSNIADTDFIKPSDINNFVKITLTIPSTLTWLKDLYYFNECFFELGATGSYGFGSSGTKLDQELNLLISNDTDLGNNTNDLILTVYSNKSLNIINNDGNTTLKLNPLTNITASSGRSCVNIGGNSYNKKIGIAGNYFNSNNTFIDTNIDASIIGNINLYIKSNYNMTLENNYIIGTDNYIPNNYLKTYIDGNGIDLIVGNTIGNTQNGGNYIFNINNQSSLGNGTNVNIPCTFNMLNNLSISGNLNNDSFFTNGNSLIPIDLTFNNLTVQTLPLINIYGNIYVNTSIINPTFNIVNMNNLEITSSVFNSDLFINNQSLTPTTYGNVIIDGTINNNSIINGNGNITCYSKELIINRSTLNCNLINTTNLCNLGNSIINGNIVGNTVDDVNGNVTVYGNININNCTISGTNNYTSNDFNISDSLLNGNTTVISQNLILNNTTLNKNLNLNTSGNYYINGNTSVNTCVFNGLNNCTSDIFNILNSSLGANILGNNRFKSKNINIENSIFNGENGFSYYTFPSQLNLTVLGNSTFSGNNRFNVNSFDISNTILDGKLDILGNTTSGNYITNLITNSTINDLHFIRIVKGNLTVSNSYIDYKTLEPEITLGSGTFSMGNSIITKNVSNTSSNNFNINIAGNIGGDSVVSTITNSQLNCFNNFLVNRGNLIIDQSKLLANSYKLIGGNINVTNSYLNSLGNSTLVNILTGTVSPYVFTLGNSVIDIDCDKPLVSTYNDSSSFVNIENSTFNFNYNTPSMSTLTQNRDWFDTSNIINFNSGIITFIDYTNNKNVNMSSNDNITINGNYSEIVNSIINIIGLKKMVRSKSPITTNSVDIEIIDTTTTALFNFSNFSMRSLFSSSEPKYYIDYQSTNNILGNTSGNISFDISNINFYLTPNVYSVTSDLVSNLNNVPDYKLYINYDGNYFIGYDKLVQLNTETSIYQDIYLNSNIKSVPLSTLVLSGVDGNTLFNRRLVLNIEELNNTSELSLSVNSSGLNIFDNRTITTNRQTINLNNSSIDISGNLFVNSSALNIESNTTLSRIIIGNSTFTTNSNTDNSISFINIIRARNLQDALSDRIVEINSSNYWYGKAIYFIQNNDNTFLNVNSKPNNSIISKNYIYWPYLNEMSRVSPSIINPLIGNSIQFAQSWISDAVVPIYNNVSYDTANNGLSAAWNDTIDTTNKCLKFVQAYSPDAFTKQLDHFSFSLTKTHNNTTTSHTGKFISGNVFSDTYSINHTNDNHGFITGNILFNSTELVLMPTINYVNLTFKVNYSDTTDETIINDKNIYTITNSSNITTQVTNIESNITSNLVQTIQEYLNTNFVLTTSDFHIDSTNYNYNITMNDSTFIFMDGNQQLQAKKVQDAVFSINSIINNRFYFLTPININLTNKTFLIDFDPGSTITYPGIDTIGNDLGNSNKVTIKLLNTPKVWTTAQIEIELNSNINRYYHTESNPLLDITITNKITDNEIYGYKLEGNSINHYYDIQQVLDANNLVSLKKSLILDNTNFTAISSTGIDNRYQWNYGSIALLVPSTSYSGNVNFIPSVENIRLDGTLIDNNEIGAEHVNIELVKYTLINGTYVLQSNNEITPSETDTLIRYMINVTVENVQEKYLDTDYDITFEINNSNGLRFTPFTVNINYFRIPIIAELSESIIENKIYRDTPFNINLKLSGRLHGKILLLFPDTGTNTKDGTTPYDYTTVINRSMKFIDNGTTNNYDYLIDMDGNNTKTLTYEMMPITPGTTTALRIGNFLMNCVVSRITNTIASNYTIIHSYNISNLQYIETLKNSISLTMKKLLDNNNFEMLKNVDFSSSTTNNKLLIIERGSDLISGSFDKKINVQGNYIDGNTINGNYLTPINKFTRYYIAMSTTILGFDTSDNNSKNIITTFTFKNENDVVVNDVEVIKMNGNIIQSSTSITLQYLNFQNKYNGNSYADAGNDVLIFRRNPNSTQTYTTLNIYYTFDGNSISSSNYQNLPTGEQLLGTIDYSHTSVTFADVSTINIGNFKIFPSGDGKYLMITNLASSLNQSIPNYIDSKENTINGILLQLPNA